MSASICCTFGRWTIHYPFRNGQSFDLTMDGVAAPGGQGTGDSMKNRNMWMRAAHKRMEGRKAVPEVL